MTPDRCGTNRPLSSLTPGDHQAVEDFLRFLHGEIAMDVATGDYVDLAEAGRPGVATVGQIHTNRNDSQEENPCT